MSPAVAGPPTVEFLREALPDPRAREWLEANSSNRIYAGERDWARAVAAMNLFEARDEFGALADEFEALNAGAEELIRTIRDEDMTRERAQEVLDRTFQLRRLLRDDLRRRYRRKRTALLNFEELLIAEGVSELVEKAQQLRAAEEILEKVR